MVRSLILRGCVRLWMMSGGIFLLMSWKKKMGCSGFHLHLPRKERTLRLCMTLLLGTLAPVVCLGWFIGKHTVSGLVRKRLWKPFVLWRLRFALLCPSDLPVEIGTATIVIDDFFKLIFMERTLVLIKPDGIQRGLVGEILHRFERKGLKIIGMKMMSLDEAVLREHYAHIADKAFYPDLEGFMMSTPVIAICLEGLE